MYGDVCCFLNLLNTRLTFFCQNAQRFRSHSAVPKNGTLFNKTLTDLHERFCFFKYTKTSSFLHSRNNGVSANNNATKVLAFFSKKLRVDSLAFLLLTCKNPPFTGARHSCLQFREVLNDLLIDY